jgi:hypothetical protein
VLNTSYNITHFFYCKQLITLISVDSLLTPFAILLILQFQLKEMKDDKDMFPVPLNQRIKDSDISDSSRSGPE